MKQHERAIAIVGLSCRYPGAGGPLELWENSLALRRQFRRIPDCRFPLADYFDPNARDKTYAQRVAVMDWKDFDYAAHDIARSTFESTDAVQWLALQVAIEAMADAGYTRATAPGIKSGVIFGNTLNGEQSRTNGIRLRWPFIARALREASKRSGMSAPAIDGVVEEVERVLKSVFAELNEDSLHGSMASAIAGRISQHFGFDGSSMIVDGACASSLLAIATAAGKLERGELDLAIAGGVDISLDPLEMIGFAGAHALTRGEMSVYDRRASGFIPGEGCGVIVLKRLADAERDGDPVHAIIRGWGISSDGRGAIAAPSSIGQSKAILRAYENAGYSPRELDFIEGHGTGTPVGDRAELEAVYSALRADRDAGPSRCGITSLKSLIGHTKAASGIAGLIKATIAVNQRVLPPTANCSSPHVLFEVTAPRLYPLVEGEVRAREDVLRAGVSGMGFGGINCHLTLESSGAPASRFTPSMPVEQLLVSSQETEVFLFGADSKTELIERMKTVASDAAEASIAELTDLAFVLAREVEDRTPRCRAAIVAQNPEALTASIEKLIAALIELPGEAIEHTSVDRRVWARTAERPAKIGMIFPGQGSQQLNIGKVLLKRHAWAAELVAAADRWMVEVGSPRLSPLLYRSLAPAKKEELEAWRTALTETSIAQPAICLTSLLWRRFLTGLGVKPAVVAGHSLGELSAFAAAGAFDEERLIKLAARRGQAMSNSSSSGATAGTMASLLCSRERAEAILARVPGYAVVANINGPAQTVISGEVDAVSEAIRIAESESISARKLAVSNAFHSRLVERASQMLRAESPVQGPLPVLETAIIAGASGEAVAAGTEMSAHFAEQVLDRVDFMSMIKTLGAACELVLEVGPSRVLSGMAAEVLGASGPICLPLESAAGGDRDLNAAIAALFVYGQSLAWTELYAGRLVRDFVPARARTFFTNPCERPFAAASEDGSAKSIVATAWSKSLGLPAEFLERYLALRGEVVTEVMRADLQAAALESKLVLPETFRAVPAPESPATAESAEAAEAAEGDEDEQRSAERDPRESHPSAVARQDKRIEREIINTVADRLELDPAKIDVDARLTDDLGLSVAEAIEAIEDIAEISGVQGMLELEALADVSIARIAGAVRLARQARRPLLKIAGATPKVDRTRTSAEVRIFGAGAWQVASLAEWTGAAEAEDWASARVVVLADGEHRNADAIALAGALESMGAIVFVLPYSAVEGVARGRFSHIFALLPAVVFPEAALSLTVDRLHAAARASLDGAPLRRKKDNALVFVQRAAVGHPAPIAFARSLHLERPGLRVRVVEVSIALSSLEAARCAIRETLAPARFCAAAYDRALVRRTPRIESADVRAFAARNVVWSKEQVAVVTGGAEGLTAECAIALARATGLNVVVLSRPDATNEADPARRVQIERNLARYRDASVNVVHMFCDLTDADAVRAACDEIPPELGEVALVIHGASQDEPVPAERSSADAAYRRIEARVLGAHFLMLALADRPLKLFAAITSGAGVTGEREQAWSALGSELVQERLARFEVETGVRALAIANDVWSPIGMGGRAGAVTEFNRYGLEAIPPEEGARRFVELMMREPGGPAVLVTAKSDQIEAGDLRSA